MSPILAVFAGGTSSERQISLDSGRASASALARHFPVRFFSIDDDALPPDLDPSLHIVFSTLHGGFGEGGGMQTLLENADVIFAGCDAASSALTMDKARTKAAASAAGVLVAPELVFNASSPPTPTQLVAALGPDIVIKPNDQGSSVGLVLASGLSEIAAGLASLAPGSWIAETRLRGRELSVGILRGQALGVVEIRPKSGVYDFTSKYTQGATEYLAPAPLDSPATELVRRTAERAFASCSCRDYARVDFFLCPDGLYLLEINTLPGMKEMSLLPTSARCFGLDFDSLVQALVAPALERFHAGSSAQP